LVASTNNTNGAGRISLLQIHVEVHYFVRLDYLKLESATFHEEALGALESVKIGSRIYTSEVWNWFSVLLIKVPELNASTYG
jgi:hypothetical protein